MKKEEPKVVEPATTAVLKKVQIKSDTRPKSAVNPSIERPAHKSKPIAPKKPVEPEEKKPSVEIPFAENRLKGQFISITEDLIKKA